MHLRRMGSAGMECGGKGEARHTALAGKRSLVPKIPKTSSRPSQRHLSLTSPSVLHRVVSAGTMSRRSPAKAVSPFVPHSATALHALAPHGKRRYGVRWEGRSPPHRFGWKTFPCAKNAENIQPSLTAPAVLHRVVSAGTMSSRSPAKAVSPFVPHSATALHALAPPVPPRACVRAPATVSIRPR
jgi:hypothetical protein